MACSSTIRLNIGGKKFWTTVDTLTQKEPQSMLAAMFSGRHTVCKDSDKGYVFVDRDGKHFRHILNWLRDGVARNLYELERLELFELLQEAEYYQLLGLVDKINEVLKIKDEQMNIELTRTDIIKYVRPFNVDRPILKLRGTNLSGLDLSKLDLSGVDFSFTCLKGVNFSHAILHSAKFVEVDAENAIFQNAMMSECSFTMANLRGAMLAGANLYSARLQSCSLRDADLRSAILKKASFYKANLEGTNMEEADLSEANLSQAQLKGANLQRASLYRATLLETRLEDAKLEGANLFQAVRKPQDRANW